MFFFLLANSSEVMSCHCRHHRDPMAASSHQALLLLALGAAPPRWRCDEDMTKSKGNDPLEGLGRPMTRARARKAKEILQQVLSILFEYKPKFQGEKSKVVSCTMTQMEED